MQNGKIYIISTQVLSVLSSTHLLENIEYIISTKQELRKQKLKTNLIQYCPIQTKFHDFEQMRKNK